MMTMLRRSPCVGLGSHFGYWSQMQGWRASALVALSFLVGPASADEHPVSSGQKVVGYRSGLELPVSLEGGTPIQVIQVSPTGSDGPTRGTCPEEVVTLTNASFTGGNFVVQGGLAESEIAAAQYVLPAADFPLRIDLTEMIWATSNATVTTTTQWSVLFWSGRPDVGTLVASHSSDGVIIPHLVLPPGTNGANIQFSVDPGDPDQIIIQAPGDGSNSFTVGYRIDQHNNQTQNPCSTAPPSNSNAFPTTDTGGLHFPTNNWVFAISCPPPACPSGWKRFSQLGLCRPSGDWVLRVTYTPIFCAGVGACCAADGTCSPQTQTECQAGGDIYQGDGTDCTPNPCPQPTGACCLNDGSCLDEVTQPICVSGGGTYLGDNSQCATAGGLQACCFGSGPNSCLNETEADCIFIGGSPQGVCSVCLTNNTCPLGACCLPDGSCLDNVSQDDCLAQTGTYQGNLTLCSGVSCPQPDGACCLSNGNCVVRTQAECAIIPNSQWKGALTDCADGNANGQPDVCEAPSAPAATMNGVVSRKTCDLSINLNGRVQNEDVTSEARDGRIDHLRIAFNVAPGGPGAAPVTILQQTGCPPGTQGAYVPYSGFSSVSASIAGNALVLLFTPGLENARTYKFQLAGPPLTSVTGQAFELRGLRGDVTSSGSVNATDRSAVVGSWTGAGGFSCASDIDLSGQTNSTDRSSVVGVWTGPSNCAP